ncbi:MAG: rRNA pseudouridine synthase [Candidatus Omnitrophica bacterium]|nr:rRNA pseudouridine synthase [Candidatus Omnitrophota bacterium]
MRLQVFLSHSGICSRRKALELIKSYKVKVNGLVVTEPSLAIDPNKDIVNLDDRKIFLKEKIYILLNKPRGVTTTKKDRFAKKTVMDLLPGKYKHLFPVGRLDKDTTGLLILTNDGDLSYKLTHPSFSIDKVYIVSLDKELAENHKNQLQKGVNIDGNLTSPCKIIKLDDKTVNPVRELRSLTACADGGFKPPSALSGNDHPDVTSGLAFSNGVKITIHEGRKRQIKRMFALFKYKVIDLKRVVLGNLSLGDLSTGHWRKISNEELSKLEAILKGNK